jgi:oxygen-independent coproporphyrinogen-3 oxidase
VAIVGDHARGETSGTIAQYVDYLIEEIQHTARPGRSLETVFFGGGTPSLLAVPQLERILRQLDQTIGIGSTAEISMEMDPGTFDRAHLQGYVAAGVNRVSLGVQAFQAELLAACGRAHTPTDIVRAIDLLHQTHVTNYSLDLISGLPHQTLEDWQISLQQAIALAPTHLSVYDLTVEPVTAFGRWYRPGDTPLPSDETTAQMYCLAQHHLTEAGFEHYEISNYAKPGFQCRHNRVYWENHPFYGFGMGAASYLQGQRVTRPRTRAAYFEWVAALVQGGAIAAETPSITEQWLETLMLGLRLAEGIDLQRLVAEFGEAMVEQLLGYLQPYQQRGWVEITASRLSGGDRRVRLTDPAGFLFSNVVLANLFEKFE